MNDIRQNIINSLAVLGLSQYQFCKRYGFEQSNLSAFLAGGKTLGVDKLQKIMAILDGEIAKLRRFLVKILLSDGNRANVRVYAPDGDLAIRRIMEQPELVNFIGDAEILKVEYEEIPAVPLSPENFLLQKSSDKGWWVVTDKRRNIVCKFKEGDFQNTQKSTVLFENSDLTELEIATSMREIADYLQAHHSKLL